MSELQTIEVKLWDRLPEEPDNAWFAFQYYIQLPLPRYYKQVVEAMGVSAPTVKRWGTKYRWRDRSEAYDRAALGMVTAQERDMVLKDLQLSVMQDAAQDYKRMRDLWLASVETLLEVQADSEDGGYVKGTEIKALFQARSTLDIMARRLARMPMSFIATEEDGLLEDESNFVLTATGPVKVDDDE